MTFFSSAEMIGDYDTVCSHHCNPNDCKVKFDSGAFDMVYAVMVWAFICEWMLNSLDRYSLALCNRYE